MKKMTRVLTMAVVMSLTSAILTGCGCSNKVDNQIETSYITETQIVTDEQGNTEYIETAKVTESSLDDKSENEKFESKVNETESSNTKKSESSKSSNSDKKLSSKTTTSSGTANPTVSNNSSSSPKPNSTPNKNQSLAVNPHAGKTYHEAVYKTVKHPAEYKDVKVIDREAYTYEEPIYKEKWITVCNHCGADITNNFNEHLDMEMDKGYGGSYHDEPIKEQIGTETINVPEEYHWETKKVKDEWTEKVLVKEAGYY